MRALLISHIFFIIITLGASCSPEKPESVSKPVKHDIWNTLLKTHVSDSGNVNYLGFIEDSLLLNQYLDTLESAHPNQQNWTKNQRLAYWINAYNAFTIQIVIRNYPIESIKDIEGPGLFGNVWKIKFITIENKKYSLSDIEHEILRKEFDEPKIHFAIVCASISCPVLLNEAYVADSIDSQLENQASVFINDKSRNQIKPGTLYLSEIFNWFKSDFTRNESGNGSLIDFLNHYSAVKIEENATIKYLDYNWGLNQ